MALEKGLCDKYLRKEKYLLSHGCNFVDSKILFDVNNIKEFGISPKHFPYQRN